MKYTKLPGSNVSISCIGFGCWQLGGHGWGLVSEQEMVNAIHKAIDLGINLFDTAPIYGLGHSEELLGRALGNKRKNVIIATKVGLTWKNETTFQKFNDSSPANIIRELDISLKRLGTDYIDLYQIHWPDIGTPIGETLVILEKLKQAGKILNIGCCNFDQDLIRDAQQFAKIASVQTRYNLIDQQANKYLIPFCHDNDIGVLTYSSLADGLLSGKYDENSVFSDDDHRSKEGYFKQDSLKNNLIIVERVKFIAKRLRKTASQVALRWVLDNPSVMATLVGIKRVSQIEENAAVYSLILTEQDRNILNGGIPLNN